MKIVDKRTSEWGIGIMNENCPFLTYPRCDVACKILENENRGDSFCSEENCPLKIEAEN
jgi:hypothetical protein